MTSFMSEKKRERKNKKRESTNNKTLVCYDGKVEA